MTSCSFQDNVVPANGSLYCYTGNLTQNVFSTWDAACTGITAADVKPYTP